MKQDLRAKNAEENKQASFENSDQIMEHEKENSDAVLTKQNENSDLASAHMKEQIKAASDYADLELTRERIMNVKVNYIDPGFDAHETRNNYRGNGSGGFSSGGYASGGITINNTFSVNALSRQNALMFSRTIIDQVDEELGKRVR